MSSRGVQELIKRVFSDVGFKAQFLSKPDEVLSEFDLTAEEKDAIKRVRSRLALSTKQGQIEFECEQDPFAWWLP